MVIACPFLENIPPAMSLGKTSWPWFETVGASDADRRVRRWWVGGWLDVGRVGGEWGGWRGGGMEGMGAWVRGVTWAG